ncbi:nuclear transport factor 2 family protein [Bacillus sp. CGMCC 1.16607]|uniref:nuclear transport factor 2 family protein n=1 Tax=Bacillus sp. CGMCC 1.16607 TaxID=3351842 RepID=UPI00363B95BB
MINKTPEQLAQLQLDAYNSKQLQEFIDQYDDNIVVLEFPSNKVLMEGKEAFTERYRKLFLDNPDLNADLKNRTFMGNHVIDHEYLTGRADGSTGEAIAIYEVNDTHIVKVWFIK